MSIFGKIKDAIFGGRGPLSGNYVGKDERPAQPAPATPTGTAPAMPQMDAPVPVASTPQPVDPKAAIAAIAAAKGNPKLNWDDSIVDLLKLLDIDSSLDNREELATELGYTGKKDGSAEMNIWLHKAVMDQLAKSGGHVPASLKD